MFSFSEWLVHLSAVIKAYIEIYIEFFAIPHLCEEVYSSLLGYVADCKLSWDRSFLLFVCLFSGSDSQSGSWEMCMSEMFEVYWLICLVTWEMLLDNRQCQKSWWYLRLANWFCLRIYSFEKECFVFMFSNAEHMYRDGMWTIGMWTIPLKRFPAPSVSFFSTIAGWHQEEHQATKTRF